MAAVLPVVPLTAVRPEVADWIATALMLASLVGALWLLNVRDWRIYGVVLLWPAVIEAIQTANASLPLTLLVAVMWRYRDRAGIAGAALGYAVAVKLFVWPVVVWLALIGRRSAAAVAAAVAAASLLLVLPFIGVADYVRLLRNIGETFEHEAYTLFAVLTDIGVPDTPARAITSRSASACSSSRGAVEASAWRSPPRSSCRRSCGDTSLPCSSCRSPCRVHGSTSCGSFPSGCGSATGRSTGRRGRRRGFSCSRRSS